MCVIFLLDFTQPCKVAAIDALIKVFEEQLDTGTLVGFQGVGTPEPLIRLGEKTADSEAGMLDTMRNSKHQKMVTDTALYKAMSKCVNELGEGRLSEYSKWLIVLSDTVNYTKLGNDVSPLVSEMRRVDDLNLAFIDTANMPPKWKPENPGWPEWSRNLQTMVQALKFKGAISEHIEADNLAKIDAAFESVAALMDTGGAAA